MHAMYHEKIEPNAAIELYDADVEAIVADSASITIRLKAFVHRSAGTPGIDSGTGWMQTAFITIHAGKCLGVAPELPCMIDDGDLTIVPTTYHHLIPCPLTSAEIAAMDLVFTSGHRLRITGVGVTIGFSGDPEFVDFIIDEPDFPEEVP